LPKHTEDIHPYQRRQPRLHASCLGWLCGVVWFCLATSVLFSVLWFPVKPGKCSLSSTSTAITYSAGWKEKEQAKAGYSKKLFLHGFRPANYSSGKLGLWLLAVSALRGFSRPLGCQAKTETLVFVSFCLNLVREQFKIVRIDVPAAPRKSECAKVNFFASGVSRHVSVVRIQHFPVCKPIVTVML
jgi:hypothetical protein